MYLCWCYCRTSIRLNRMSIEIQVRCKARLLWCHVGVLGGFCAVDDNGVGLLLVNPGVNIRRSFGEIR